MDCFMTDTQMRTWVRIAVFGGVSLMLSSTSIGHNVNVHNGSIGKFLHGDEWKNEASGHVDNCAKSQTHGNLKSLTCFSPKFTFVILRFHGGVNEEQMLKSMGSNTLLRPLQAKVLKDEYVGFEIATSRSFYIYF